MASSTCPHTTQAAGNNPQLADSQDEALWKYACEILCKHLGLPPKWLETKYAGAIEPVPGPLTDLYRGQIDAELHTFKLPLSTEPNANKVKEIEVVRQTGTGPDEWKLKYIACIFWDRPEMMVITRTSIQHVLVDHFSCPLTTKVDLGNFPQSIKVCCDEWVNACQEVLVANQDVTSIETHMFSLVTLTPPANYKNSSPDPAVQRYMDLLVLQNEHQKKALKSQSQLLWEARNGHAGTQAQHKPGLLRSIGRALSRKHTTNK